MDPSPHVLLYTDDPGEGGVAQYNHAVLLDLRRRGYRVTCAQSFADTPLVRLQAAAGVRHLWLEYHTIADFPRTLADDAEPERILREARPDLVLFSDNCPPSSLAAKAVAARRGIPSAIVEGFVAPYLADRFDAHLPAMAAHYERAREVVAVSRENLGLLHRRFGLPQGKGRVIYYGRPDPYFAPPDPAVRRRLRGALGLPEGAVLCFTAARLEAVKGYHYQLATLEELRGRPVWPLLHFAWAGPGSLLPDVGRQLRRRGLDDRVTLLGQRWDVADWLDAADLFVLPSEAEGMPLAVMEAMAKGLPVVASGVSGIPEQLGETGRLLPAPTEDPDAFVRALAGTIEAWAEDDRLRRHVGAACRDRASALFREGRMLAETHAALARALLPAGDYVCPDWAVVLPDRHFPHMAAGDPLRNPWPHLRREVPHPWYVDRRFPNVGWLNRDEAHILHRNALQFRGRRGIEVGCFLGWSTCHLALAGLEVDAIDPLLAEPIVAGSLRASLQAAGVLDRVRLHPGASPEAVLELGAAPGTRWALGFIDGRHEAPAPVEDARAVARFAAPDAMILFHDLAAPAVAEGLAELRREGWETMIYQTTQVMGVAWRGDARPAEHRPDPGVSWAVPDHLASFRVCGGRP